MPQNDEELIGEVRDELTDASSDSPDEWPRKVVCPITGKRVIAHRPGSRRVTSEEIYRLWREDFP